MASDETLRRLGGGRWETKDGRFAIEPQSGTWVVVDTTQVNELGLPLVRGPYPSLGAAREAIAAARTEGPAESPLADRLAAAGEGAPGDAGGRTGATRRAPKSRPSRERPERGSNRPKRASESRERAPEPPEPPEPKWLRDLDPAERRAARRLVDRLAGTGVEDPLSVVRDQVRGGAPALARLALERRLREAIASADDPAAAVRAAVDAVLGGEDEALLARWQLVDGAGRRITELDLG